MLASKRSALIVASDDYADPGLKRLRAPARDARALAAVLREPAIGDFEVGTLLNKPAHEVNLAVEEFFADRRPDDLLLLHFSGHGVKDEGGELYFAMANTLLRRLGATAVAAEFVSRCMSRSRSRRVVLLLDCCYAGAFERGMTARAGDGMGIESQFGGGRGRAVITASSAMEYAFEGDQLTHPREPMPSVFTSALVEGLETGDADRDQDGLVALDELYDYIYDKVRVATPHQTPGKWTFGVQGELIIARRARAVVTPAPLPAELQEATDSPLAAVRGAVVQELARLRHGTHAGRALAAQLALERLAEDDSRTVAAEATAVLRPPMQPTAPAPRPAPAPAPATLASGPGPAAPLAPRRAWMAIAAAGVLVAAGIGGYLSLGRGGRKPPSPAVSLPSCTTRTAAARALLGVPAHQVTMRGMPFDAVVSGRFGFVSLESGLAVMNTAKPVPRLIARIPLSAAQGEALTPDKKYLLVSGGSGITVFRVGDLERGSYAPLGRLSSPGGSYAVEVAPSPNGKFAFVTLQNSGQVAVFNLQRALAHGFGHSGLVRTIPVGAEPIGIAPSADGRYLYVTQGLAGPAAASGKGSLVIVDMGKAEKKSADPIVHRVDAGCGPARVVAAANGKTVWVTVGGGNALLAYSAAKLISDPVHALIARVAVGQTPLGLVMVGNGTRIVLADSNRDGIPRSVSNLAVVDVPKALAGAPALIGVIRSGMTPRQFALEPDGTTLLVTNTGSHQVQAVDISHLPLPQNS